MLLCDSSKEEASGINKNRESRGYITYTNDSQSQVYSLWGILGGGAAGNRSNCHASLYFYFLLT